MTRGFVRYRKLVAMELMLLGVRLGVGEEEVVSLTLAVVAINGWNRLAISFRSEPGTYQPA